MVKVNRIYHIRKAGAGKGKVRCNPNTFTSYDVVNNIDGAKGKLKKAVYNLMKKDSFFQKPRVKFNTLTFKRGETGYGVDFSPRQRHDGVTSVWRYYDYKKIRKGSRIGYSYRKQLISDVIFSGDKFSAKDTVTHLKHLIERHG